METARVDLQLLVGRLDTHSISKVWSEEETITRCTLQWQPPLPSDLAGVEQALRHGGACDGVGPAVHDEHAVAKRGQARADVLHSQHHSQRAPFRADINT